MRYQALVNSVQLQREIFFSALMTEEMMVESTMPDIVDSWLVEWVKTTELDDIQWGTFPFWSKTYVSLGTVMWWFPSHWFGLRPSWLRSPLSSWPVWWFIMFDTSTPLFVFFALFLHLTVLWSCHYDSYDSHDPHIFLSFSHIAQPESRLTFIWLFIPLTPLSLLTQPAPLSLSSFYFYLRCIIFRVTLCHGHSSIYSVVAVQCSSLALIS